MGNLRLSKAVKLFMAWGQKNLAVGTLAGYEHYLTRFTKFTKDKCVERVTPALVESWSNRWHAIQSVTRLYSFLHLHARKIKTNPLAGMKLPKQKQRKRILTPAEMVRMMRNSSPNLRKILLTMRETIARPGEIRDATWECVRRIGDLPFDERALARGECFFCYANGKAFARRSETEEVRMIPIPPRIGRMLLRLVPEDQTPEGKIFLRGDDTPWSKDQLVKAIDRVRRLAGFKADWRGEKIVAYSLRHTSATNAAAGGLRDALLSAILGHTTPRMTRRYVHLQPDMIQEGMKRIIEAKTAKRSKKGHPGSLRTRSDDLGRV